MCTSFWGASKIVTIYVWDLDAWHNKYYNRILMYYTLGKKSLLNVEKHGKKRQKTAKKIANLNS